MNAVAIPDVMHGVQLIGHGGLDMLRWNDAIPVPTPGPGQVLVQVLAAGVNNTDINTRTGWYNRAVTGATGSGTAENGGWAGALDFPRIQGGDLCGRIVALGEDVTGWRPGQRVTCPINQPTPTPAAPLAFISLGSEIDGAFARFCVIDAAQLFDVTDSPLSDVEIAAMPCAFGTAWNLLERAAVAEGDDVLVTGASGGVGLAAVALASLRGARVTAQCSPAKGGAVRDVGATTLIDRAETPPPARFDACIDVVGGKGFPACLDALKPGGRLATSGAIAGAVVECDLRTLYLRDLTLFGCTHQSLDRFAGLVALINAGRIRPLVSQTYPLRDIARAQEDFMSKRFPGKLVLIP